MIRLSPYLQDEEPFYILLFFWKEAAMDVISEIFDMIGDILELVITQVVKRKEAKENKQDNEKKGVRKDNV